MQKKPGTPKKQAARAYSSESLLLRSVMGILLIALGILAFVSVVAPMDGAAFSVMKAFTQGLAGGLCLLLPLFVVWTGILTAFSARKKMPIRALLLSSVIYLCLLALINLVTYVWDAASYRDYSLMEYIGLVNRRDFLTASPDSFPAYLSRAFLLCQNQGEGGGLLGMLLAWPLYIGLGNIGGVAALVIAILGMLLLLSRIDLGAITANMQERMAQRREQRQAEEAAMAAQDAAYRRQEALRQAATPPQKAPPPAYDRRQPAVQMAPMAPVAPPSRQSFHSGDLYDETIATDENANGLDVTAAMKRAKQKKNPVAFVPSSPSVSAPEDLPWEEDEDSVMEGINDRRAIAKPLSFGRKHDTERVEKMPPAQPDFPSVRVPVTMPEPRMSGTRLDEPDLKLPPQKPKKAQQIQMPLPPPYAYPTLDMLKAPKRALTDTREEDAQRAMKLEDTLQSFGIDAQVKQVTHGPAITRFELELASGINVRRITSITDNIALSMAASGVRIEAPIPGKSLVGIEVPNAEINSVTLREVLESDAMSRAESTLAVALGKDIAGSPIICDLSRMPHLLIAGATGSGKSVCINGIINSILFRSSPKQVRMILIDPKVVELQCYNGIPHLLIPVVSDPHKAAGALTWAVTEMMERYHKFTAKGVREITGYNAALGEEEEALPRIVVIIDELADLMMACKKDVEESICRLAQLARAAGIHLVVATQRPSVDVITGLIKANIPSRIAFAVSSNIDSRTILDGVGAEKLLGRGDMLYSPSGARHPMRVQGCFVSDGEVNRVTGFIRSHADADYDPNILEQLEQESSNVELSNDMELGGGEEGLDPLLRQAIEMAVEDGQTSISMLQRRLRIGYARSGRLIDEMTRRGIISQAAGAKPRQVLLSREDLSNLDLDA